MTTHRRKKRTAALIPLAATVAAAVMASGLGGAQATSSTALHATGGTGPAKAVTLITGDMVTLSGDGNISGVQAAKGREELTFRIQKVGGHNYVVPQDAEQLVAKGRVDRRLFDVTQLIALHYDDVSRADLPLIVTYPKGRSFASRTLSAAGARITRDLPSVNGDALRARKADGAQVWQTLAGSSAAPGSPAAASAAHVEKIWLDGKVRPTLDQSVQQIGAPAAWQAGYDGKDVKVAVLDSGVDARHPDVKDRISAQENFSESADTVDRTGHGTHVASTIAGSGAQSGGKYRGVAPGTRLLIGKVLGDDGAGSESSVIAGMQWAVAEGARVVNLSLGSTDSSEEDPVEQAVNELSAQSRALFVIAAGNSGPNEGTVGSPGSAAAALTVGAVDRSDAIAEFSSRGPTADGLLKPDLTAPGVGIVAAKAAKGQLGDPAADGYTAMSGTSMATPHVAGAAAILAQKHPDWTGEQIKAALTASAQPTPALPVSAQGTGRVDLARAIKQQVTGNPTSLDFGTQQYPHTDDQPVTKTLTYHNTSDQPVTLNLATQASGTSGTSAPTGMFQVSPQQLTIPAGSKATATVTADTRIGSTDGVFTGAVTAATADGHTSVRTAVAVNREAESYNLTITHRDLQGTPTPNAVTGVYGEGIYQQFPSQNDGTLTLRLPKGLYSLKSDFFSDDNELSILLRTKVSLDRDTSLVMDARKTKPIKITVPDSAAKNTDATLAFGLDINARKYAGIYALRNLDHLRVAHLGSRLRPQEGFAQYSGTWTHGQKNYRLAFNRTGDLSGFTTNIGPNQLAKVNVITGAPAKGRTAHMTAAPLMPDGAYVDFFPTRGAAPMTTTDYVLSNDIKWRYAADQYGPVNSEGQSVWEGSQTARPKAYQAGGTYTERFHIGVFGPHLATSTTPSTTQPGAVRLGNTLSAHLPLLNDSAGHAGDTPYTTATSTLLADGKEIFATDAPLNGEPYTLPTGKHTYRLTTMMARNPAIFPVSTRVTTEWTFTSATVTGKAAKPLPLSVVRFTPALSTASTAPANTTFTVPFTIEGRAGSRAARKINFAVSYDDGRTWKTAKTTGSRRLALQHPAKPTTVSLRVSLTDANGNTTKQTIYRAYRTT